MVKMKPVVYLLFSVLLLTGIDSVMYGRFITIQEAPYFISLLDHKTFDCGGVIISEYWILTAAHCVRKGIPQRIIAGFTTNKNLGNSSIHNVTGVFVPGDCESYKDGVLSKDVALVKLEKPIEFNEFKQPIKIRKEPPKYGDVLTVVGLGFQGSAKGDDSLVLKETEMTITNETICDSYVSLYLHSSDMYFCAGNGTTDACSGDSGGPAVIDGQLAGLVSFGPKCTTYGNHTLQPGAYTRLHKVYDWILEITGIMY